MLLLTVITKQPSKVSLLIAEDYNHAQVLYYTPDKQEQEKVQQRLRLPFENIDYYSGTDDSFLDKAFNIFTSRQQYMEDCSMNLWETPLLYVVISGIEHVVKDSENYAKIATLLQFGKAAGIRIFANTNIENLAYLFPGEIRANIGLRIYCENENTIHFEGGDHNVNSEAITFVPQVQQHLDRVPRSTGSYQIFFCRILNSIKSVRGEV